jgi:hypothetical protein
VHFEPPRVFVEKSRDDDGTTDEYQPTNTHQCCVCYSQ